MARLLCLVALVAAAAAAAPAPAAPAPPGTIPMCSWYAYDKNIAAAGYCFLNPSYYAAVPQEPTSFASKLVTRVMGRHYMCSRLKDAKACDGKEGAWGCSWDSQGQECASQEYYRWRWFTRHTYFSEAPVWLKACPGSPARVALACIDEGSNATRCAAAPGCAFDAAQKQCTSKALLAMKTDKEREAFFDRVWAADPGVTGGCAAACYMRQLLSCSKPPKPVAAAGAAAAAKWCAAQPHCSLSGKDCGISLYGSDAWGLAATAADAQCREARDRDACGRVKSVPMREARVAKYLDFPSTAEAAPAVKCPV